MKCLTHVKGLGDIRGMRSAVMLRVQGRGYLDLYMLEKEQERLEREAALVTGRSRAIGKRLEEIGEQMGRLRQSPEAGRAAGGGQRAAEPGGQGRSGRQWKTFALKY